MVQKLSATVVDTAVEGQFRRDLSTTTGLVFGVKGGTIHQGSTSTVVADSTVTLTDASTNIVWIDLLDNTVKTAVSGSEDTTFTIRLYQVVTAGGVITTVTDQRARVSEFF